MRIIETTVYTFPELAPDAQERAREWYRSLRDAGDYDAVRDDIVRMGEILGVTFKTHAVQLHGGGTRYDPNVWWQVGYMQSDGASFDGTYAYAKGAHRTIRAEAPQDTTLHDFADRLQEIQRRYQYQIEATIQSNRFWPQVEIVRRSDLSEEDSTAVRDVFIGFCRWMYQQFRTEDEYRSSDAVVDEEIIANEYEFTADGRKI